MGGKNFTMHMNLSEILLILLVALLVIKPEHLPGALKTLGRALRWVRNLASNIREEWDGKKEP